MRIGFLLPAVLLVAACQSTPQRIVISEDKLQSVYAALLEEGDHYRVVGSDSSNHFNADSVFHAFNISEQEFRSAIEAYRSEPGKWQKFFEGVIRKLDEKQNAQMKKPSG